MTFEVKENSEKIEDGYYVTLEFMYGDADGYESVTEGPFDEAVALKFCKTLQKCIWAKNKVIDEYCGTYNRAYTTLVPELKFFGEFKEYLDTCMDIHKDKAYTVDWWFEYEPLKEFFNGNKEHFKQTNSICTFPSICDGIEGLLQNYSVTYYKNNIKNDVTVNIDVEDVNPFE